MSRALRANKRGAVIEFAPGARSQARVAPAPARPQSGRPRARTLAPAHTLWAEGIYSAQPGVGGDGPAVDGALALLELDHAPLETTELTPRRVPTPRRILIVEDDTTVSTLIRQSLELEGDPTWEVQTVEEGLRALSIAGATPPDVVLLDVRLPGLDGAEVYRRLRANARTRAARVLLLSAGSAVDLFQRGIEDGVLLRKPFDPRELVTLVRALLAS